MQFKRFNVRVYGICLIENRLLLSDEVRGGYPMTKLPGGGLEFGEGLAEALQREWIEELNTPIEVGPVYYVNTFLISSVFSPGDQVISLYFRVFPLHALPESFEPFPLQAGGPDGQSFRWQALHLLSESDFTFPADQAMLQELKLRGIF